MDTIRIQYGIGKTVFEALETRKGMIDPEYQRSSWEYEIARPNSLIEQILRKIGQRINDPNLEPQNEEERLVFEIVDWFRNFQPQPFTMSPFYAAEPA